MRPDIEDFEELTIAADEAPRSRAMSWLVLAVAVGGFGALAYYAYHSGTQSMQNGDVLIVQADETPIKQVPTDAEGEQFANQDKTIYDVIAPNATENKVEKLLPEPEKPVASPQEAVVNTPAPAPTTFVNKNLVTSSNTPVEAAPVKPPEAAKPAPLVVSVPSATVVKKVEAAPIVAVAKKIEVKKVDAKPAAASVVAAPKVAPNVVEVSPHVSATVDPEDETTGEPTFVNETPVVEAKQAAPVAKKDAAKLAVNATAASGQIQLGAYKSQEEAETAWKKIASKNGLSGSPVIVKADLPNGMFYRLRTVASDPKAACAKLVAKGQACFSVK